MWVYLLCATLLSGRVLSYQLLWLLVKSRDVCFRFLIFWYSGCYAVMVNATHSIQNTIADPREPSRASHRFGMDYSDIQTLIIARTKFHFSRITKISPRYPREFRSNRKLHYGAVHFRMQYLESAVSIIKIWFVYTSSRFGLYGQFCSPRWRLEFEPLNCLEWRILNPLYPRR